MIRGGKREKNRVNDCDKCKKEFYCSDPKRKLCDECKKCCICGDFIKRPTKLGRCKICRKSNITEKQKDQLSKLHKSMVGENNPSKKLDVRKKLSDAKKGVLNPAHKYPEKWKAHIAKYRPNKISKLEDLLSEILSKYCRQFKVGHYKIDFADPQNKIAIEVQGCWYHSCNICFIDSPKHLIQHKNFINDSEKKKFLTDLGWKIVYIYEHEIRKSSIESIQKLIVERIDIC